MNIVFMKKIIVVLVLFLGLLGAALVGGYFYLESQIKSGALDQVIKDTLSKELKVDFDYGKLNFSFENLMKFKPTLLIEDLKLANTAGFKQKYMLETKKIFLELYLEPLLARKVEIKRISIERPHITLETNAANELNYVKWLASLESNPAAPQVKFKNNTDSAVKVKTKVDTNNPEINLEEVYLSEIALKHFEIKHAQLDMFSYGFAKPLSLSDMDFELKNLHLSEKNQIVADIEFDVTAFNSGKNNLVYKGELGPIESHFRSLPSSGELTIDINVADIPQEIRKEQFGNFLLAPNDSDRFLITSKFKGDLLGTMFGDGLFDLNNINVGKSKKRHLKAKASIPVSFSANLAQSQKVSANIKDASLNISSKNAPKGLMKLNAKADYNLVSEFASGAVSGSLENFDINELISSFSDAENMIHGKFSVPGYSMNFNGADSKAIMKSLNGKGSILINDGKLYMLDRVIAAKEKAKKIFGDIKSLVSKKNTTETNSEAEAQESEETSTDKPLSEETKFSTLATNFYIQKQKFFTDNIEIITPVADVKGGGFFNFKQKVHYDMNLDVKDIPIKNMPLIPIKIRNTMEKPSIKPDFSQLGKRATQERAQEAIDYGLGKLNSFLQKKGLVPQAPNTAVPASTSPAAPVDQGATK